MNKSVLITVVLAVVILVAGIGYVVFSKKTQSSSSVSSTSTATMSPVASSNPNPSATGAGATTPETVAVSIEASEYKFSPDTVTVKAGQRIRFTVKNLGRMPHNWVVEGQNIATTITDPGMASVGEFTAPSKPGTYVTFCSVGSHRAQGMVGKLIVQ